MPQSLKLVLFFVLFSFQFQAFAQNNCIDIFSRALTLDERESQLDTAIEATQDKLNELPAQRPIRDFFSSQGRANTALRDQYNNQISSLRDQLQFLLAISESVQQAKAQFPMTQAEEGRLVDLLLTSKQHKAALKFINKKNEIENRTQAQDDFFMWNFYYLIYGPNLGIFGMPYNSWMALTLAEEVNDQQALAHATENLHTAVETYKEDPSAYQNSQDSSSTVPTTDPVFAMIAEEIRTPESIAEVLQNSDLGFVTETYQEISNELTDNNDQNNDVSDNSSQNNDNYTSDNNVSYDSGPSDSGGSFSAD